MAQFRDEVLLQKIAIRFKTLREKKRMSQEEVYNATEIHIARIETAKVNISVSTLSKLCDYYEISLADFFREV
jgi:transcriptional regulator with XRE-family HTH domain